MPFGGGGGGTSTQVVNATPFNADQIRAIDDRALSLLNNNPLNYYPGQTYAPPVGAQNISLDQLINHSIYGANLIGDQANIAQQNALTQNNAIMQGQGFNSNLGPLGQNNPASTAVNGLLNTFSPGGWFSSGSQGIQQQLLNQANSGAAQNLGQVARGDYVNANAPWTNALANWNNSGAGAGTLNNVANGMYFNGSMPILSALQNAPNGTPEAGALNNFTSGSFLGGASPYIGGLENVASGSAARSLSRTADGTYLGPVNPWLDAQFQAAARPVVSAFQTAVSPRIDSAMEAAGRFNSGANANAQTNAQETLGKTLGDLSAGIYGPAYESERNRQIQAAQSLGNLQTQAYGTAGQLYGQQTGQIGTAAGTLGQLRGSDLANALQGYNTGVNTLSTAASNYGDLAQRGYTNALAAQNQAVNLQANAADALMRNQTTDFSNAGQLFNQMGDTLKSAYGQAGSLNTLGQNSQISAIDSFLRSQMGAMGQVPGLSQMPVQDWQTALNAGNIVQQQQQAGLNDLMQRFYGEQFAPYSQLGQIAGIAGTAIPGTSATTSPVAGGGFSNVIGGLSAANSLFGGGSGGGLLGAGGLGGIIGTPGFSTAALFPGATAATLPAYAELGLAGSGGSGILGMLPFLAK